MRKLRVFFNTRVPENEIKSKSARQIKPLQVASRLEMKVGVLDEGFPCLANRGELDDGFDR